MVTGNPFWLCHSGEVFTLRDPQLSSRVKWRGQTLLCVTLGSCVKIEKDTMSYDMLQMQQDIETYGLYTYEDFKDLIPEVVFEMYNAKYLKINVEKGYMTWNDVLDLISFYYGLEIKPLV